MIDTELVVSELTTNVVQAVTGTDGSLRYDAEGKLPLLWVRLSSDRLRLMVEVWDTLPARAWRARACAIRTRTRNPAGDLN